MPIGIFYSDTAPIFPNIRIDTLPEALLAAGVGILLAPLALHLLNLWTQFCAIVTRICLGAESQQPIEYDKTAEKVMKVAM